MDKIEQYLKDVRLDKFSVRESARITDDFDTQMIKPIYTNSDDDAYKINLATPLSKELAELAIWGKR